jgi:hypothetical protein
MKDNIKTGLKATVCSDVLNGKVWLRTRAIVNTVADVGVA